MKFTKEEGVRKKQICEPSKAAYSLSTFPRIPVQWLSLTSHWPKLGYLAIQQQLRSQETQFLERHVASQCASTFCRSKTGRITIRWANSVWYNTCSIQTEPYYWTLLNQEHQLKWVTLQISKAKVVFLRTKLIYCHFINGTWKLLFFSVV